MNEQKRQSRRVLGVFVLAMINVSLIASLRGLPAQSVYGIGCIFFYALVALTFLVPASLISAELATGWPETGGVYVWVKEAFGPSIGFFSIWLQWIENVIWFPTALSFAAGSLAYIINPNLANNRFYMLFTVLAVYWGSTLINLRGMKASGIMSSIGAIFGTMLPGALVILLGAVWMLKGETSQISFATKNLVPDMTNINNLVFAAGIFLLFAGIEVSAVHAKEVKNPSKDYPKAILLSCLITVVLFALATVAIAIVVPEKQINIIYGLMQAFKQFFSSFKMGWAVPVLALMIGLGAIGQVASWIVGPSKGLMASATAGDIPPLFSRLNEEGMPAHLLVAQGVIVTVISMMFILSPSVSSAFWILGVLTTQLYLIMYILMYAAGIYLRYKRPEVKRPYRVPGGNLGMWLVAGVGTVFALAAIIISFFPPSQLQTGSPVRYVGFLVLGNAVMCVAPFVILKFRKADWVVSKEEIGEEE